MMGWITKTVSGSFLVFASAGAALAFTASACSDSSTSDASTDSGKSDGSQPSTDSGPSTDAGTDSSITPTSVCTQAELDAGDFIKYGAVDISQASNDAGDFVYVNPCAKLKVGQKANFGMDFAAHPLQPTPGSGTNPIPVTKTGANVSVTFSSAGTFGYHCEYHSTMQGEIQVVP